LVFWNLAHTLRDLSGSLTIGSNLQALIDASHASPSLLPNAHIAHVISNRSKAFGLQRAASSSPPISTSILVLQTYLKANPTKTRADYDLLLAELVLSTKPDLIVLAGFMHILSPTFLSTLSDGSPNNDKGRPIPIINLHPALPGAFDGANAIPRALEAFGKGEAKGTGVMVHRVVEEVDQGEPVLVREVEIKEGEGLEELEERIHGVEHEIIVQGARKVLEEIEDWEKEGGDSKEEEKKGEVETKKKETQEETSDASEKKAI
jgi:formyltetrahydrofolate-dependent phosphoribosylglycinamide formyltransferase